MGNLTFSPLSFPELNAVDGFFLVTGKFIWLLWSVDEDNHCI